jgi:hypothetical protein
MTAPRTAANTTPGVKGFVRRNLEDRFWEKVDIGPGCWTWRGARNTKGYGRLDFNGPYRVAHRVMWELTHGPIPDGLFVLHHCDNPPCVRPTHLYLGTKADNNGDMWARGRASGFTRETGRLAGLISGERRRSRGA